jgi:hypothetical protein
MSSGASASSPGSGTSTTRNPIPGPAATRRRRRRRRRRPSRRRPDARSNARRPTVRCPSPRRGTSGTPGRPAARRPGGRARQCLHEEPARPVAQGVGGDVGFERRHRLLGPSAGDQQLGAVLDGEGTKLVESRDLGRGPWFVTELVERLALPQGKRFIERGKPVGAIGTVDEQVCEQRGVDRTGGAVAGGVGADDPSPIRDRTRDTVVRSEPLVSSRASQRCSDRRVAPFPSASAARSRRCAALGRSTTSPRSSTNRTAPNRRTKAVAIDPSFGAERTEPAGPAPQILRRPGAVTRCRNSAL